MAGLYVIQELPRKKFCCPVFHPMCKKPSLFPSPVPKQFQVSKYTSTGSLLNTIQSLEGTSAGWLENSATLRHKTTRYKWCRNTQKYFGVSSFQGRALNLQAPKNLPNTWRHSNSPGTPPLAWGGTDNDQSFLSFHTTLGAAYRQLKYSSCTKYYWLKAVGGGKIKLCAVCSV